MNKDNIEVTKLTVDGKSVWFFDNVFPKDQLDRISKTSARLPYTFAQLGNSAGEDSRRGACHFNLQDIVNSNCLPYLKDLAELAELDLVVEGAYTNLYQMMTTTARHTDFYHAGYYTFITFNNVYWHDDWGGELTCYGRDKINYTIEFVPGRVVLIDARVEHRVNPLTPAAKDFRFSTAYKCCTKLVSKNPQNIPLSTITSV